MSYLGYDRDVGGWVQRIPPDLPLALMDLAMGGIYLLAGPGRTSSPTFALAKAIMPIRAWGAIVTLVGLLLLITLLTSMCRRWLTLGIRVVGPATFAMWSLVQLFNAIQTPSAAIAGVPIYAYLAFRHTFAPVPKDR